MYLPFHSHLSNTGFNTISSQTFPKNVKLTCQNKKNVDKNNIFSVKKGAQTYFLGNSRVAPISELQVGGTLNFSLETH